MSNLEGTEKEAREFTAGGTRSKFYSYEWDASFSLSFRDLISADDPDKGANWTEVGREQRHDPKQ